MLAEGTTVVITGCGHIERLMKNFPQAEFPLANEQ